MAGFRPSRHHLALASLHIACAFGCASGGPGPLTAAELAGREAKVIVVAPLNVATSLPVEIEGSSEIVSATLVGYLEDHGKSAQELGFRAGRDLWLQAAREVTRSKQQRNFENAASAYARQIAKQVDYDVLIIPTLYVQTAVTRSRFARWDGALESVHIEGKRVLSRRGWEIDSMNWDIKAASIMVAVLSSDGSEILSKRRGLQLIEFVQFSEVEGPRRDFSISNERYSPPLNDSQKIRAGIAAVLSPFLPELAAVTKAVEAERTESE